MDQWGLTWWRKVSYVWAGCHLLGDMEMSQ
jgi:hypothetical protein